MSLKSIKIIVESLFLIPLLLAVPHSHVYASLSSDIKVESLSSKEKSSHGGEEAKVSKAKKVIIIGVPKDQESLTKPKGSIEIYKKGIKRDRSDSAEKEKKTFKTKEEAEEYLNCLLEERKVLEGDFFGINITAYRYVNIFYRRGYIGYKIFEIDKEIKRTKSAIRDLERITF